MRKFNSIKSTFWRKLPKDLPCDARYVLIYLLTNDATGPTGIQPISDGRICSDCNISGDTLHDALMALRKHKLIIMEDGYIWTPLRWMNEQTTKGKVSMLIQDERECMPDGILKAFNKLYNTVPDTLSNTVPDSADAKVVQETETETDTEIIQKGKDTEQDPGLFKPGASANGKVPKQKPKLESYNLEYVQFVMDIFPRLKKGDAAVLRNVDALTRLIKDDQDRFAPGMEFKKWEGRVLDAITWAANHDFWGANFQAMAPLRRDACDKFSKIYEQWKQSIGAFK